MEGWPTDNGPVTLVERYDPREDRWSSVGNAPDEIYGHTATLLHGGKVLIAGGNGEPRLFDPANGTWRSTGPYEKTDGPSAVRLASGDVLLTGGSSGCCPTLGTAQRFDASTATWRQTDALVERRRQHTVTLLRDGNIFVAGGFSVAGQIGDNVRSTELATDTPPGSIGPAITGSWFNPAQSGHGLFVQVLPGERILAAWLSFDPSGAPAWFLGAGTYSGNTATISEVEQPTGGRWIPNFDAGQIVHKAWGTLEFTFTDCNHGRVSFNSVAGFGSGSMDLARLTQPAVTCP